jgi:phosphatidylglycerophosphatase A
LKSACFHFNPRAYEGCSSGFKGCFQWVNLCCYDTGDCEQDPETMKFDEIIGALVGAVLFTAFFFIYRQNTS